MNSINYCGNPNLYAELNATNIIPSMEAGAMFGPGRWIDIDDEKLHHFGAIDPYVYWIYTNPDPDRYCMIYREIETGFRFIPTPCLDCWKVVVIPRSFHELMQLYELQKQLIKDNPKCWCKCGVESRDTVGRHYGGYFYTPSKEVGLQRYETVRKAVDEYINKDVTVLLKRYCTEFEMRYGPSDKYEPPPHAKEIEKEVFANIVLKQQSKVQPEFVRRHVIQRWMIFAHGRADPTVRLYNNNKPLFPDYVTYHDKPKE